MTDIPLFKRLLDIIRADLKRALAEYKPDLTQATGTIPARNTPSAGPSDKGGITLTRDLGGTSTAPLVVGLQGRDLAATAPTNGQAVVWNDGASTWEPGDVAGGGGDSGYAETIGDGLTTSFTITHSLGTRDVVVQVYNTATYAYVFPDIATTTVNTLTLTFATAPAAGAYRVVVGTGGGSTMVSGGLTNPMTTQDDIIIGGSAGAVARLAKGTDGQVLTVDPVTHHLLWKTPTDVGFANPMTTEGDLIKGGSSGTAGRLAVGAAGKILTSDGTDPVWGNGPMTAVGDLIAGGTSGAPTRLAVGTAGQVMVVSSGTPAWSDVDTAAALTLNNVRLPFDVPPTSPHTKDDEFTGTSLNGRWTTPITSACAIATTVANHWLVLEPSASGTASTSLRGGFGIYQVSPTGNFTISAKIVDADRRGATANTDDGRTGIFVARTTGTLVHVLGHQSSGARNANVIGCATYNEASTAWGAFNGTDANTATLTGNIYTGTWYKIQWDTGGTLTFFWSPDGLSWRTLTAISSLSQPDRIGLCIYGNTADIRADHQLCCDWFRVTEP